MEGRGLIPMAVYRGGGIWAGIVSARKKMQRVARDEAPIHEAKTEGGTVDGSAG